MDLKTVDELAVEWDYPPDWREHIVDRQLFVVTALQGVIAQRMHPDRRGAALHTGEIKDLSVALGVAVDKLVALTPGRAHG